MNNFIATQRSGLSKKTKIRNYSFESSKRLPLEKMTEVNSVKVPSMPGSCYHAIICALACHKNIFVQWDKVIELTERFMKQYGGQEAWEKFKNKSDVKTHKQRIKDNTHTLTRTGKDCYGYRLHERGMCIYFFKDGACLMTNGDIVKNGNEYDLVFPDGRGLQIRYRGTTMTSREYKRFLEAGFIDKCGKILNAKGIKRLRASKNASTKAVIPPPRIATVQVCIELEDGFNQETAFRLQRLGLVVDEQVSSELMGSIKENKIGSLRSDPDVKVVEVAGE